MLIAPQSSQQLAEWSRVDLLVMLRFICQSINQTLLVITPVLIIVAKSGKF